MKRLRGKAALATWPERLAAVKNEPTEDNLQRLCSVLDEADAWVVRGWGGARHDDRRATLRRMRAEARDAQAFVTAASRKRQAAQAAARRPRKAPATTAVGGDAA